MNDSNGDTPVGGVQDGPFDDSSISESQRSLQHIEPHSKKLDKSKRQSKQVLMGTDNENANLRKRTSKMGIFGLFNRSKVLLDVETPQVKMDTQWEGIVSTERPVTRDPGAAYIPPQAELDPIQETSDVVMDTKLRSQASKSRLRNRQSFKWESKKETKEPVPLPIPTSNWTAPPLFQVYPQSIKYSTLKAPLMSAEAILRLSKDISLGNEGNATALGERSGSVDGKPQKEKKLKKATALEVMAKSEWVDKTYVLVTAGYILQYAGQGTYDRVPEKILQLTDLSAAFATDAIPGKPFVLQISQALNEDGTVDTEMSRSMFKKMGGLRADMRRAVSNFLLVLESPEEMNEWLVAVRKEIEALGGREHNPEQPWDEPEDKAATSSDAEGMPSQRYLVKRSPNQFSPKTWSPPQNMSLSDRIVQEERFSEPLKSPDPSLGNRQSMATQNSMTSRNVSDTHASIDQVHLDRLRESFASTAERTNSTSRDSSPNRSPLLDQDFISEIRPKPTAKTLTYPENGRRSRQRIVEYVRADRESLQSTPTPSSRPNSKGTPPRATPSPARTMSPESRMSPPPNFSVPTFSKRYSATSTSPAPSPSTTAQSPPPITILQESSLSEDDEIDLIAEEGGVALGQLHDPYKSSPRASMRLSSPQTSTSHLSSPPTSRHSHITPPGSSDGERPYSRRFSSLDYARGISPVKPAQYSPSPHPPPNIPLPPLPDSITSSRRTSLIPPATTPPAGPLPPLPVSRGSSEPPTLPPPTYPLPPVPSEPQASGRTSTQSLPKRRSVTPSRLSGQSSAGPIASPRIHSDDPPSERTGPRPATPSNGGSASFGNPQFQHESCGSKLPDNFSKSSKAHDISTTTPPLPQTGFISTFTIEHQAASQPLNTLPSTSSRSPLPLQIVPPPPTSSLPSPPKPTRAAPPPPPPPQPAPETEQTLQPSLTPVPIAIRQAPPRPRSLEATATSQRNQSASKANLPRQGHPPPVPESALTAPPPTPPLVQTRKKLFRMNRETPPASTSKKSPKIKTPASPSPLVLESPVDTSRVFNIAKSPVNAKFNDQPSLVSSPIEQSKEQSQKPSSPHPFIPPIKLSHSREKGSFDGPWNLEYDQGVVIM